MGIFGTFLVFVGGAIVGGGFCVHTSHEGRYASLAFVALGVVLAILGAVLAFR